MEAVAAAQSHQWYHRGDVRTTATEHAARHTPDDRKLKIAEQHDQSNIRLNENMKRKRSFDSVTRLQCRTDSLPVVMIIVPLVFSFLTDGYGGNGIDGDSDSDDDNNEDGYDYNEQFIVERTIYRRSHRRLYWPYLLGLTM